MAKKDYDVIVVGCGPGGATAANFAALNGMKVLVVEQKREVGLPIQDGVSALYSMSEVEEAAGVRIEDRWIEHLISQHAFFSPSGKCAGGQLWPDGINIQRSLFEKGLAENAIQHGVEIWVDTRMIDLIKDKKGAVTGVKVIRSGEVKELSCSVLIGADGVYGNVARLVGIPLPRECIVGLSYQVVGAYPSQPAPPAYEIHIGNKIAPGFFAWVLPHSGMKLNVGVNVQPIHMKEGMTLRGLVQRFMKHLEEIGRYRFEKAGVVSMMSGVTTTIRHPGMKIVADGVMLIGDGAWRPLLGCHWGSAGMLTAIYTGRWAAEVAAEAIKKGDVSEKSLSRYPARCAETLAGREVDILEAREYYRKVISWPDSKKDEMIEAIGNHISTLHLYLRGAFHLSYCLQPIKEWFILSQNPQKITLFLKP